LKTDGDSTLKILAGARFIGACFAGRFSAAVAHTWQERTLPVMSTPVHRSFTA